MTLSIRKDIAQVGFLYDEAHVRIIKCQLAEIEIQELYMLMGKELEKISYAPAGTVFGIGGVEDVILKTATITTNLACPTFIPMTFGVRASFVR